MMDRFKLPYAGGCDLGTRTIEPHMIALRRFGLVITATEGIYHAEVERDVAPGRPIVLTERGDTVTENSGEGVGAHTRGRCPLGQPGAETGHAAARRRLGGRVGITRWRAVGG